MYGLKPWVLQELGQDHVERLTEIYKHSVKLRHVPMSWRKMRVIFLPKDGKDAYDVAKAFRPITLSNVILKTLERLLQWNI